MPAGGFSTIVPWSSDMRTVTSRYAMWILSSYVRRHDVLETDLTREQVFDQPGGDA